jgi:hypothetical protein
MQDPMGPGRPDVMQDPMGPGRPDLMQDPMGTGRPDLMQDPMSAGRPDVSPDPTRGAEPGDQPLEDPTPGDEAEGNRPAPTHDEISVRAYFLYLETPESDELGNWLRAERELTPV